MGAFADTLARFKRETAAKADEFVVRVVLEFRTRLVVRSPVDTGRFRNNWLYGLDVAPTGQLTDVDPSGARAIARIGGDIPVRAAGHVHYLVNNLAYGRSLESGGSKQAPSGMVGITILEGDEIVARAAQSIR